MKKMNTSLTNNSLVTTLSHACGVMLLLLLLIGSASAQGINGTQGSTPSGLAPGAAAGSYSLSDFDTVNVYNGNVNFHLPLVGIGGRGGAQMSLMLSRDNPKWGVTHTASCGGCDLDLVIPAMAKGGGAPLGAGVLKVMKTGTGTGVSRINLTRIMFTAADGTEYELLDKVSNGAPKPNWETGSQAFNRGNIFVSVDGTAATFFSTDASGTSPDDIYDAISEPINGYLVLRDGTRFWIESTTGSNPSPLVKWMRDRNGNLLMFDYDSNYNHRLSKITDSLNRVVNISYSAPITVDNIEYSVTTTITYTGFNGSPRTIRIQNALLSDYALRDDYIASDAHHGVKTYGQLFPELLPYWDPTPGAPGLHSPDDYYDPVVPKAVVLPDGRSYQLRYNRYGELARVELPTGGAVEYKYTTGSGVSGPNSGMDQELYRRVKQRLVKARRLLTDNEVIEQTTNYGDPEVTGIDTVTPTTSVTVDNAAAIEKHYFYGDPVYYRTTRTEISYGRWNEGHEYKTEVYTVDGETLLRRVENTWRNRVWLTQNHDTERPNDPLLVETVTTLGDDGATNHLVTKRSSINPQTGTLAYDAYCNPTDTWEYAYGAGSPGALLRHTHTDYLTTNINKNYAVFDDVNDIHIRSLPLKQQVFQVVGSSETEQSRVTYEYDKYDGVNHAALLPRSGISGHDTSFSASYLTRGNLTATTRWLLPNQQIATYQQYDVAGNLVKTIDALDNATTFSYTDNFGQPDGAARTSEAPLPDELGAEHSYAFATRVTNPQGHDAYMQYEYYLGVAVDEEDANGVVASAYYGGTLDRPVKAINDANNLVAKRQTTFTYLDSSHLVRSTGDLIAYGDNKLKLETVYDDLGRTVETRSFEGGTNYIRVEQKYDTLGRASKASNPYRPYLQEPVVWTTTSYDALGRVISVKTPDNAMLKTIYSGNLVTVTDQSGRDKQSTMDALGRLTKIVEDPGGLNYQTSYTYDAQGNLLTVQQGGQQRTYEYDSLSRVESAENPETGMVSYRYDDNGNLVEKKDQRLNQSNAQVTITYTYDKLNRVKTRSFNDGTPVVSYFYDVAPSSVPEEFIPGVTKGQLVAVIYDGDSNGSYYGHDALGRVTQSVQQTDGTPYTMSYGYNLMSNLISESYPSGRVVKTGYDVAGRINSVTGVKDNTTKTYANGFWYTSHGAVGKMKLGNGLWEHTLFNTRLQPIEIGLGLSATESGVLKLKYTYGQLVNAVLQPALNNGNVQSQTISVPKVGTTPALTLVQSYTYDEVNRLAVAQEKKGAIEQWKQSYTYANDSAQGGQYGNMRLDWNGTTANARPDVQSKVPAISIATNRITTSGYSYDAAGNMINAPGHSYGFNAENRMVRFDAGTDHATTYIYDGDGRRVKKVIGTGSLAVVTTYVCDAMGKLVAEYATNTAGSETGTRYLTEDTLSSTRMVTTVGSRAPTSVTALSLVKTRSDYLPFGEELAIGIGGRTQAQGYLYGSTVVDNNRQKFTGYEHDNETSLDYAQARYYASTQGRFTSIDPTLKSAKLEVPQSWNRYIYALNNPLYYVDPDGQLWILTGNRDSPFSWVDQCPAGQTCYRVGLDPRSDGLHVYGSNNAQDITTYQSNASGMIDMRALSGHHDANFIVAGGQNVPEEFVSTRTAANFFAVTHNYGQEYPNDQKLVFTAGNADNGRPGNCNGSPCHGGHQGNEADLRYMDANGRPIHSATAYLSADIDRTTYLMRSFHDAGMPEAYTGDTARFGSTPASERIQGIHRNHLHVGVMDAAPAAAPPNGRRRR